MKANKLKKIIGAIGQILLFASMLYMGFSFHWSLGVMIIGLIIVLKTIE